MKEIIINNQTEGGRLDKFLIKYLCNASGGFIYKMLRKKNILLNDKKALGSEILKTGDSVKIYFSDDTIQKFTSENRDKSVRIKEPDKFSEKFSEMIVFEDENIIAVNKPSGMLSQNADNSALSVNDLLLKYLKANEFFTPGISNRLDRNTSGLILAGKNPNAVRSLNSAIKERALTKLYLCVCLGKAPENGNLEGYLVKDEDANTVSVTDKEMPGGDYIHTAFKRLSFSENYSLLEVELITGKSHQIRAHLASIGAPIAGDPKYGSAAANLYVEKKYRIKSQLLHAYKINFNNMPGCLEYLNKKSIISMPDKKFMEFIKGEGLCLPGNQEA